MNEDHTLSLAPNFERTFLIPREQMPQLAAKDVPEFLRKHGFSSKVELVHPHSLSPTQSQFNPKKIADIDSTGRSMPILVSSDNYVLDGHHRWLANAYAGEMQPVIKLPVDAAKALDLLHSHEATFRKGIAEEVSPAVSISNGAMDNTVQPVKKRSFKMWRRTHVSNPKSGSV